MQTFAYEARDSAGALVRGSLQAANTADAAKSLRQEGKYPVKVVASRGAVAVSAGTASTDGTHRPSIARGGSFRFDDVIQFAAQLAVLVDTGVALADALETCRGPSLSPAFSRALEDVIDRVKSGTQFWAALAAHPRVFPPYFVSMIKASEASGTLPVMLQRVGEYLSAQRDLKKKIKGAVTYPCAMLLFAVVVTIFLLTFVLPRFASIYAGREQALPAVTRYLLAFATGLKANGLYVLAGLIPVIGLIVWHVRRPAGRAHLDWFLLHVPILGPMFHKTYLSRSLRTLGTMIQNGVVMLDGVELTRDACGSLRYEKLWNDAFSALQQGRQLSDTLAESPLVPRPITQMVMAGERGGRLGAVLERVAAHCEAELSVAIKTATSMLEPLIIGILGTVVGGLVIALLLPIFTISRAMKPG